MANDKGKCSGLTCERGAVVKGLCKRCYMAGYWQRYYAINRIEILAHLKLYRRPKQSQ